MTALTLEPAAESALHLDTHAAAHGAEHEHEHDVPGMNRLGLLFFMASETMLFLAMAAARFYLAGTEKEHVNMPLGIAMTGILLLSSWFGYRAVKGIAKGNRKQFVLSIAAAFVLGIIFIGGVVIEWTTAEFSITSPYGTAFYAMTGLHVFHLLQGLLAMGLLLWLGIRGHFGPGDHWGATGVVRFWTFVDIMWLAIVFPVLYIL
jgi:cytochrome c oxidase subunit 3